ncbi:hypothetical protein BASA81_006609 [Batrachochytrium salamandrivorans]|nr:hypothetical protein BASA81_006609 [Batrachochytrium salamandrivorans]
MNHQRRNKSSKQHKAALELASQRRQLAKVLKREGVNPTPVFEATKRPKISPAVAAATEEEEAPATAVAAAADPVKSLADKQAKLKLRQKRSLLLSKKTRKGQPVMRNVIGDLVSKLQHDNADTSFSRSDKRPSSVILATKLMSPRSIAAGSWFPNSSTCLATVAALVARKCKSTAAAPSRLSNHDKTNPSAEFHLCCTASPDSS